MEKFFKMYVIRKKYKNISYFYLCESVRENGKVKQKTIRKFKGELPEKYKKYYLPKIAPENIGLLNSIFHGDSFDLMEQMKRQNFKVDLIIADVPYNIAQKNKLTQQGDRIVNNQQAWGKLYNDNKRTHELKKWFNRLALAFFDVLNNSGSCLIFFDRGKPHLLEAFYQQFQFKNTMVFVKNNPLPKVRKINYRSSFEQCFWFVKSEEYFFKFLTQKEMCNVFYGNIGAKKTTHPNEKYAWMIEPLIKRHSRKGDIVFDSFAGSGVVAEVCKRYKRKYILCDQEKKFLIEAKGRL